MPRLHSIPPVGRAFLVLLFLLVTLAAFGSSIDNYYVSEDIGNANWNYRHVVSELTGHGVEVGYRPLTALSWAVMNDLFPLQPLGWHLLALLLQCVNGAMLYWIVDTVLEDSWIALGSTLLWLILPVHAGALNWLVVVANQVLNTTLCLLSIVTYMRYRATQNRNLWAVSVLSLFAALLTKESAASLPLLLVLLPVCESPMLSARGLWSRVWAGFRQSWIHFLVVLVYVGISWWVLGDLGGYGGATHLRVGWFVIENFVAYLRLVTLPFSNWLASGAPDLLVLVAMTLLATLAWWLDRRTLWFTGWFVVALLPILTIGVQPFRAHWSSMGCTVVLISVVVRLVEHAQRPRVRPAVLAVAAVSVVVSLALTYREARRLNLPWEVASQITRDLPHQVRSELPEAPPAAELFFLNLPDNIDGAWTYRWGLQPAMRRAYGDKTVTAHSIHPYGVVPTVTCAQAVEAIGPNPEKSQVFFIYDLEDQQVARVTYDAWKDWCASSQ